MSEYQYYKFQAIDRPLSEEDRRALRALSARARITATSFTNSYEWGDFKGDPAKLVERWFDLHLYLANWGSRRLIIKVPARLVDRDRLGAFLDGVDAVRVHVVAGNLIVDVARDELEFEDDDAGSGRLAGLAPLRADLLAGDLRVFYLLWLTAVEAEAFEPDEPEPMPGVGPISGALQAFATFFGLDPDLVQAAAEPGTERVALARRTGGDLRLRARAIRLARERAATDEAARARRRQTEAAETARRARLETVRRRGESVWREIETDIERRNAAGYDRAAAFLSDLRALAKEQGAMEEFSRRLQAIRERHVRKERFIQRLTAIG